MQAAHDRSDGHAEGGRGLGVTVTLDVHEGYDVTERGGQTSRRPTHRVVKLRALDEDGWIAGTAFG